MKMWNLYFFTRLENENLWQIFILYLCYENLAFTKKATAISFLWGNAQRLFDEKLGEVS